MLSDLVSLIFLIHNYKTNFIDRLLWNRQKEEEGQINEIFLVSSSIVSSRISEANISGYKLEIQNMALLLNSSSNQGIIIENWKYINISNWLVMNYRLC